MAKEVKRDDPRHERSVPGCHMKQNLPNIKPSTFKLIEEAIAIQEEDATKTGTVGFMARSMVMATLPHRNPIVNEYERRNGNYTLTIIAPSKIGLPYGTYPRLLLAWISTEAVRTKNPDIVLGKTLSGFMEKLGLLPTGGRWGTITQLKNQTSRLFASSFSCRYADDVRSAGINMTIAKSYDFWWTPQQPTQGCLFESTISLNRDFFDEITKRPIPIDMRALKALKSSAMALDIYMWSTWRVFALKKKTTIPWELLQNQFGSLYQDSKQGRFRFKENFRKQLHKVKLVYQTLNIDENDAGLILLPSQPHIPMSPVDKSVRDT